MADGRASYSRARGINDGDIATHAPKRAMNQTPSSAQLQSLLAYVESKGVCPIPYRWQELWDQLPGGHRGWFGRQQSAPRLMLANWWDTPPAAKRTRLRQQLEWAAEHGGLDQADRFLRGLRDEEWFRG